MEFLSSNYLWQIFGSGWWELPPPEKFWRLPPHPARLQAPVPPPSTSFSDKPPTLFFNSFLGPPPPPPNKKKPETSTKCTSGTVKDLRHKVVAETWPVSSKGICAELTRGQILGDGPPSCKNLRFSVRIFGFLLKALVSNEVWRGCHGKV